MTGRVTVEDATTIPAGDSVSSISDADNPLPAPASVVPPQSIALHDFTNEIPHGILRRYFPLPRGG